MADFKTAEQYVVEKVEFLEKELKYKEIEYMWKEGKLQSDLDKAHDELTAVYNIISFIRDKITLGNNHLTGPYIALDEIYRRDKPDAFDDLLELLGISLPSEEEDNEDA